MLLKPISLKHLSLFVTVQVMKLKPLTSVKEEVRVERVAVVCGRPIRERNKRQKERCLIQIRETDID